MTMFKLTNFTLGDVDDPHLYAQLHIDKLRKDGLVNAANVRYELGPDPEGLGFKVEVYDADREADWENTSSLFQESMRKETERSEKFWNSLTIDDQINVFCAVVRRICKAELDDHGTYRYALYNVFGFGPESYGQALNAGYMALHNSIFSDQGINTLIGNFVRDNKLDVTAEQIKDWTFKHRYY